MPTCFHCDKIMDATDLLELWDGKTYCRPCVDNVSPKLAERALARREFSETLPYSLQFLVVVNTVVAFTITAVALLVLATFFPAEQTALASKWRNRQTTMAKGKITVTWGAKKITAIEADITQCQWFVGPSMYDTVVGVYVWWKRKRVVIVLPTYQRFGRMGAMMSHVLPEKLVIFRDRVVLGWTEDDRTVVEAFVGLAKLKQIPRPLFPANR